MRIVRAPSKTKDLVAGGATCARLTAMKIMSLPGEWGGLGGGGWQAGRGGGWSTLGRTGTLVY